MRLRLSRIFKVLYKYLIDTIRPMNKVEQKILLLSKYKSLVVFILLGAFLFVPLHTPVHNSYDHNHDSSCNVYVLEQLYFGSDIFTVISMFALFLPFTFFLLRSTVESLKVEKYFAIRAPPSL